MSNRVIKDGENTFVMYGISTGETGRYGVGDIVEATHLDWNAAEHTLDDEPIYYVFAIDNRQIVLFDDGDS